MTTTCTLWEKTGYTVDVVEATENPPSANGYDFVVVGSGIRADKWTKETLNFIEKNAQELRIKKAALFVNCQMANRKDEGRKKRKKNT